MFCALRFIFRVVFKKISFFPRLLWLFIVLSVPLPSKLTVLIHKTSIFHHHLFTNLQEKVWFIYFSQSISCFSPWFLRLCVFVEIWKYNVEYGLWIFCWVCCMGFVSFGCMLPIIHVFHVYFSFLSIIPCLCCVVHIIPMIKCLRDIFLCYCGCHGIQCL